MIPSWFQTGIYWKIICFLMTPTTVIVCYLTIPITNCSHPFFPILRKHVKRSIMWRAVSISQYLSEPSITTSGLWLTQANLKDAVFIWKKKLQPCFFKAASSFDRTSGNNCCFKGTVLNAGKPLRYYFFPWWMCEFDNFKTATADIHKVS